MRKAQNESGLSKIKSDNANSFDSYPIREHRQLSVSVDGVLALVPLSRLANTLQRGRRAVNPIR